MVLDEARREGIDGGLFIHLDHPLRRVSTAFSFDHDRGFISYSDQPEALPTPDDLRRIKPRFLLLQGFPTDPDKRALAGAARDLGISVCSDCQHFRHTISRREIDDALQLIDIFLPNLSEALSLTGTNDIEAALEVLASTCPTVVIKQGRDGATAIHQGMRCRVPALEVDVIDTTGAGDSFNAGFVHGLLNGEDFESALETGVICGSLAVTGFGGRNLPFREDLQKYRRLRSAARKHQPNDARGRIA
jgi:sugar/nucleoside kinase (ribokinase family)